MHFFRKILAYSCSQFSSFQQRTLGSVGLLLKTTFPLIPQILCCAMSFHCSCNLHCPMKPAFSDFSQLSTVYSYLAF